MGLDNFKVEGHELVKEGLGCGKPVRNTRPVFELIALGLLRFRSFLLLGLGHQNQNPQRYRWFEDWQKGEGYSSVTS